MSAVQWAGDGIATGGTSLFGQNVATLWGGPQNVLSVLSVNVMDATRWGEASNAVFATNMANWLADEAGNVVIPEPSTFVLAGVGLALAVLALRRRRA